MISGNIDILLITETKIDSSFPNSLFQIDGYTTPYLFDRDSDGEMWNWNYVSWNYYKESQMDHNLFL